MESPIDCGGVYYFDAGCTWASEIEVDTASLIADHKNSCVVVTGEYRMSRVGLFCGRTFGGLCCDIDGDSHYMRLETEVAEVVYRRLLLDYDSRRVNPP